MTGRTSGRGAVTGRRALDPADDKSELIRRALEPFGLRADDQQLWTEIAPTFYRIARDYKFLIQPGATPRIGEVEDQLSALANAATDMAVALGKIGTVAFDWLFVFQVGENTLSRRAREKGRGPRNRPGVIKDGMRCCTAPKTSAPRPRRLHRRLHQCQKAGLTRLRSTSVPSVKCANWTSRKGPAP
jgi:hypothetical protein